MISEEKKAGACAAVLILTGLDQIAYVIASLQLGAETFWWLRVGVIAAFLFLGLHLLVRGPKFSRAAALLIAAYLATRLLILFSAFRPEQLVGFVLPTAVHLITLVVLLRLPRASTSHFSH